MVFCKYITGTEFDVPCHISDNHQVTLQWIPSHCDVQGNDKKDILARKGLQKIK